MFYVDLRKKTHPEEKESENDKFKESGALKKRSDLEVEKRSRTVEPELETREKRRCLFSSVGPDVGNAHHMEMDTSGGWLIFLFFFVINSENLFLLNTLLHLSIEVKLLTSP